MVGAYRPKRDLPEVVIIPLYDDISIIVDGTTTYMFGIRKGDQVILFPGTSWSTTTINSEIIGLAKTELINSGVPEENIRENRNIDLAYPREPAYDSINKFDIKPIISNLLNLPSLEIEDTEAQKALHCFVALTFESARNDLVLAHMLSQYAADLKIDIDAIIEIGKKWSNGSKYTKETVNDLASHYMALGMFSISTLDSISDLEKKAAKFHEITGTQVRCIREFFHMINMVKSELLYLEPFSIGLSRRLMGTLSSREFDITPRAIELSRGLTSTVRGGVFSLGDSASVLGRVFVDMASFRTERGGSILNFPTELGRGLLSMVGKGIEPFVERVSDRLVDMVRNRESSNIKFDEELIKSVEATQYNPKRFARILAPMVKEGRFKLSPSLASRLGVVLATDILSDIDSQVLSVPVATNLGLILVNIIRRERFNPEPFAIELSRGLVEIAKNRAFNLDIFAPELSRMLVEMVRNGFDPTLLTGDSTLGGMLGTLDSTESNMLREDIEAIDRNFLEKDFAVILSDIANRSAINPELFRIRHLQEMIRGLEGSDFLKINVTRLTNSLIGLVLPEYLPRDIRDGWRFAREMMNPDQLERGNGSLGLFRTLVTSNFDHKQFWQNLLGALLSTFVRSSDTSTSASSSRIIEAITAELQHEPFSIVLRDVVTSELNAFREDTEGRIEEL